jgi:hypothetical protein
MKEEKMENYGWSVKRWPNTSNIPLFWEDELDERDSLIYRREYTREIISNKRELRFE